MLTSPTKRSITVHSLSDFFFFLRVLSGEHSELELAEVLSASFIAVFHRVLRMESCSLASKASELQKQEAFAGVSYGGKWQAPLPNALSVRHLGREGQEKWTGRPRGARGAGGEVKKMPHQCKT